VDSIVLDRVDYSFILLFTSVSTALVILLALLVIIRSPQLLSYTISFLSLV
ncbi:hypothetical protein BJ875DRAFT_389794, partial [Amylocarpus encephaloides]